MAARALALPIPAFTKAACGHTHVQMHPGI